MNAEVLCYTGVTYNTSASLLRANQFLLPNFSTLTFRNSGWYNIANQFLYPGYWYNNFGAAGC